MKLFSTLILLMLVAGCQRMYKASTEVNELVTAHADKSGVVNFKVEVNSDDFWYEIVNDSGVEVRGGHTMGKPNSFFAISSLITGQCNNTTGCIVEYNERTTDYLNNELIVALINEYVLTKKVLTKLEKKTVMLSQES